MAYIINKTNGEQLLILEDGTLNTATSVGLLGKNTIGYGEVQNENFVRLLENFAGASAPSGQILKGQIYYNTENNQLNVYDGTRWLIVGNAITSADQPAVSPQGTLWLKASTKQLYVYDTGWKLIGPDTVENFGITRAVSISITDTLDVNHAVVQLVVDGTVIAIMSADLFTIKETNAIPGFSVLKPGLTMSTQTDIKGNLDGNALTATKLQNIRTINGVAFDGTTDITISASSPANLKIGNYLVGSDYSGNSESTVSVNASSVMAADTIVARDASGNFAANEITANLVGNVTGNVNTIQGTSQFNDVVAARFEGNLTGNVTGLASSASRLEILRTINGVGFNGTSDITIKAATPNPLVAGSYLQGQSFDGSGTTEWTVIATAANQPNNIVARDSTGNFSANAITANSVTANLTGNVNSSSGISNFNIVTANQFSGNLSGNATGNAGSATKLLVPRGINGVVFDGTQNITIKASTTNSLLRGSYILGENFDGSAQTVWTIDASSSNQVNKIVARDNSGNFSANTITASLVGNVQGNVQGNLSGTTTGTHNGPVNGNVLGNVQGSVTGTLFGNAVGSATNNVLKTGDTMTGRLTVSTSGIAFPTDAFGGSGDSATITLETKSGESTTLTFRVTNDADDTIGFFAPSNNGLTMNNGIVWHSGNDGAGSGLDADLLDGLSPSTGGVNNIVARDNSGNFSAGTITAALTGTATGNVRLSGDSMSGYLTLVGAPVNADHAATKSYVDTVAGQNAVTFRSGASYSTTGFTNQVGSFNYSRNYFDIFPPAGKTMSNLLAFIPSIHVIHFAGGVNGDDSLMNVYEYYSDRIRVRVQNTEQRSTPAANWLAIWR
jgi:hypothetical protein